MLYAIFGLGILITVLGIAGIALPALLLRLVEKIWSTQYGFVTLVVVRIVFGLLFILAASQSRIPMLFYVLGVLALVGASITALIGKTRIGKLIQWWGKRPGWFIRAWCGVVCALGLLIVYAAR